MTSARTQLVALPVIPRLAIVGATAGVVLGGLVGLVLGLRAYPPTAWFAVLEVGVPVGICGAVLGAFVGLVTVTIRRLSRHEPGS